MYYDAHTHLNDIALYPSWQTHLHTFSEIGGKGVVIIGIDDEHNKKAIHISQQAQEVATYATIGVHPSEVAFGNIRTEDQITHHLHIIEELYHQASANVVAIGECGVDAHYSGYDTNKHLQRKLFEQQCQLATKLQLPVVIHSRDQFEDTLAILNTFTELKIYLHCWGYEPTQIEKAIEQIPHLWIGRCGNITYPKAQPLRDSLLRYREITQGQGLLLETDAPYLSPQAVRGTTNTPSQIVHTYTAVAELLNIELIALQYLLQENFEKLYLSH